MKWYWAYGENHDVVSHIIPENLLEPVLNNLYKRGVSDITYSTIKENDDDGKISFDLPGMIMADRHMYTVSFDGLSLNIPATDIEAMLLSLATIKNRPEIAESCYKFHGFLRCLCLTGKQKELFANALKAILPEARVIADAENALFNERLAKANQHNLSIKPRPVNNKSKGQS